MNIERSEIDQLKEISEACSQQANIDLNHKMTRTMLSTVAQILLSHISNKN
mgnify:CR=1 FL=1|jgi:hypothetical protein